MTLHEFFKLTTERSTWISSRGCQMLERGVIVSRASPPAMCLSSKPILPLSPLDWDSENCTSPPPVDLVSQQGAPEARGKRGNGEKGLPVCLLSLPLSQIQLWYVVLSWWRQQLVSTSKLASYWLLPDLEACVLALSKPLALLTIASLSTAPWF